MRLATPKIALLLATEDTGPLGLGCVYLGCVGIGWLHVTLLCRISARARSTLDRRSKLLRFQRL